MVDVEAAGIVVTVVVDELRYWLTVVVLPQVFNATGLFTGSAVESDSWLPLVTSFRICVDCVDPQVTVTVFHGLPHNPVNDYLKFVYFEHVHAFAP